MRRSLLRRAVDVLGLSSFARRREQQLRKLRNRRTFLESLEPRQMLAVYPVAVDDPLYNTAMNTTLNSAVSVSANDFEADSASLTASVGLDLGLQQRCAAQPCDRPAVAQY